jgi:hypothetical protein
VTLIMEVEQELFPSGLGDMLLPVSGLFSDLSCSPRVSQATGVRHAPVLFVFSLGKVEKS